MDSRLLCVVSNCLTSNGYLVLYFAITIIITVAVVTVIGGCGGVMGRQGMHTEFY